jgi:hypothetical protein
MRKKLVIIGAILFLLIVGGYLYIRFGYLKAKDFKPDTSKQKSIIDLRPAIIAKLQQLVKDGSNGLYVLSINTLEPHLLSSKLDISNASIRIDTAAMHQLDSLQLLPDDIFTFHFSTLHIDGIGIDDLLHKDRIEITGIQVTDPMIDVYHKKRSYNEAEREQNDSLTLYERLKGQLKKVEIKKIDVMNATYTNHDIAKHKMAKFNAVSILVNDLLIDSSTKHDKSRFLFAKHTTIQTKNYSMPTADSLYFFKIGSISIAGEQHSITAKDVELVPRLTRKQFETKLKSREDMYHFAFSKIILNSIDWLAIINNEKLGSKHIEISGGMFSDFLDRSVQSSPAIEMNNFPHQLLMKVPFKVSVDRLDIKNVNLSYEEHNPLSDQNGTVYFDNINGRMNHVSNIPAEIKLHPVANFSATALFMHHVPMSAKFTFNLAKIKTGEFTADIIMDTLDNITINKISEPLGLFSVKTGQMQHAAGHIDGNNFNTKGKIAMQYNNLHIKPLKKDKEEKGKLKKMTVTGFIANALFIKNENPKGNELRQPEFTVQRGNHANFFNLMWTTILTGILKTIGVPVKFGIK